MTDNTQAELREQIETLVFARFYDVPEKQRKSIVANLLKLITADRKRVALEARIDELENNKWLPNEAKWIEQEADRIAELKAQQIEL